MVRANRSISATRTKMLVFERAAVTEEQIVPCRPSLS
jgi:hypothetical protein